jgi:hypothetical protein
MGRFRDDEKTFRSVARGKAGWTHRLSYARGVVYKLVTIPAPSLPL